VFDRFQSEYGITRSLKIICLVIKHSNNQWVSRAVILCFEKGPYLSTKHGDSRKSHRLIINDHWEENFQDFENIPNRYDSVIDIFTEKLPS
jgi:hypothetical protein